MKHQLRLCTLVIGITLIQTRVFSFCRFIILILSISASDQNIDYSFLFEGAWHSPCLCVLINTGGKYFSRTKKQYFEACALKTA